MSTEEAEEATPGANTPNTAMTSGSVSALLTRAPTTVIPRSEPSIRSGNRPAKRQLRVWRAQQFAAQRPHNEASCLSTPRLICRTWSVDPTRPFLTICHGAVLIPAVSKPLVIGVGRVCHELFLVVTAPSHGCKGLLYCTIPNRNRTPQASVLAMTLN